MKRRRNWKMKPLATAVILCAAAVTGPAAGIAAASGGIRLHLPGTSAGKKTIRFAGVVTFAAPKGWVWTALPHGINPTSQADFRVAVAPGCTALALVTPNSTATATSAPTQLRRALPAASQSGIPVPQPVRIVAAAPRAHSGAWELVAPPAPPDAASSPDGGYSFNYYGATLLHVSHARWAGLTVGLTARPSSCGTQVLHDHAVTVALTHLLRTATLQNASATG